MGGELQVSTSTRDLHFKPTATETTACRWTPSSRPPRASATTRSSGRGAVLEDGVSVGDRAWIGELARLMSQVRAGDDFSAHDFAVIGSRSRLGNRVSVGESTRLEAGVIVGDDVAIEDHAQVKRNVLIGDGATIGPLAILFAGVQIGDGATVEMGARVGRRAVVRPAPSFPLAPRCRPESLSPDARQKACRGRRTAMTRAVFRGVLVMLLTGVYLGGEATVDAQPQPGPEFRVNQRTSGFQWGGIVTVTGDGSFTVFWSVEENQLPLGTPTDPPHLLGQRFGSSGNRVGNEFDAARLGRGGHVGSDGRRRRLRRGVGGLLQPLGSALRSRWQRSHQRDRSGLQLRPLLPQRRGDSAHRRLRHGLGGLRHPALCEPIRPGRQAGR